MFTVFVDAPLMRPVLPLDSGGPRARSVKYLQDAVMALVSAGERVVTILGGRKCLVSARGSRSPIEEARGDRLNNSDVHSVSEGVEGVFSRLRQLMLLRKPLEQQPLPARDKAPLGSK